jgi:4-diphosphocytidyl-2-C-methyl-D-erythritol kinase
MRPARAVAAAKINLALVVGPRRGDGLHEVATVLQRLDVCDRIELEPGDGLSIEGFRDDTIVARALALLAGEAGIEPSWRVRIAKEIPVAAGLGGGSADAAAALRLANAALPAPLDSDRLVALAAEVGADVPFFLEPGPKLAQGTGELLAPLDLPQDFWIVVALPRGVVKPSTAEIYDRYDALGGGPDFAARRDELHRALGEVRLAEDLALLPVNDLAEASGAGGLVADLRSAGAFRADVSGAGAAVYGLFLSRADARSAARGLGRRARVWVAAPVW